MSNSWFDILLIIINYYVVRKYVVHWAVEPETTEPGSLHRHRAPYYETN